MITVADAIAQFILARLDQDDAEYLAMTKTHGLDVIPADPTGGEYLGIETVQRRLVAWLTDDYWVDEPIPALATMARQWQTHPDFDPGWLECQIAE